MEINDDGSSTAAAGADVRNLRPARWSTQNRRSVHANIAVRKE
jgi:hypothetical protein